MGIISRFDLSFFWNYQDTRSRSEALNKTLPVVGLTLIFCSVLFYSDEIVHPSIYTLLPIIGVCIIIWFSTKDEVITKILSTKLFVGIRINILLLISLALSSFCFRKDYWTCIGKCNCKNFNNPNYIYSFNCLLLFHRKTF